MEAIVKIFLLTLGASFVQRATGFGFGIFIMTLLPFLMPSYGEATALSGLLALTQTYFVVTNTMMTIVRGAKGFITPTVGKDYLAGLMAVTIGSCLGALAFRHLPPKVFPYVVYSYIGISGIIILLTA